MEEQMKHHIRQARSGTDSIFVAVVEQKWHRFPAGRKKSSVRTDAGTNGGTAILTR